MGALQTKGLRWATAPCMNDVYQFGLSGDAVQAEGR